MLGNAIKDIGNAMKGVRNAGGRFPRRGLAQNKLQVSSMLGRSKRPLGRWQHFLKSSESILGRGESIRILTEREITSLNRFEVRTWSFVLIPYNFSGRNRYLDWVRSRISSPWLGAYLKGPSRVVSLVVMSYDVAEGTG
ncbi:hypothetical protein PIB30_025406 [Stylosanthes scabra]|uniref:Uncharacterized protein n=1 Tax=Stylosanthes scabra TaxID=79078 RepID=A0ABU6RAD5_9FABA|nr:hypothetical protein [Stylosanthes scabra]